ncbi:signal transduction histidine kinase [Crossiella equi]|uniref:histidine kinase n=2 Tax=Crossiella equi TaxID=130796 RepID=A0ABS5AN70_9PSEU|nr:sensor histidine kinase [Crossiella equi]MBP2478024.1 signal transduction histidine kinase [Crossiella equi]
MSSEESQKSHRSIRTRLTGAVLIPSVALLVMWVGGSSYLIFDGYYLREVAAGVRAVSIPAVNALASAQKERQLGMVHLSKPGNQGTTELRLVQQQTDEALSVMKAALPPVVANAPSEVVDRINQLNVQLDELPRIRTRIETGGIDKAQVYGFYNSLLNSAAQLFDTQARIVPDVTSLQGGIGATAIFRAADRMSRSGSVMAGAISTNSLPAADHLEFSNLVSAYHAELESTMPFARQPVQDAYRRLRDSDAWKRLVEVENALVGNGPWVARTGNGRGSLGAVGISEDEWQRLTASVADDLAKLTVQQADLVSSRALEDGSDSLVGALVGSLIALVLAVLAILVALKVSRKLVDRALVVRLESLQRDALELAHERLPAIVRRLRAGEAVDVKSEVPDLDYGRDEIGQVARAFNAAQLTAVAAAVQEAQAREGINNVFLGIAHRNQALVHRQLKILDRMERHEEDPEQIEGLFQLDHLATRARRNAENLIILGGEQPGRRWRKPIRLVDVLRAAISETEHYARVRLQRIPDAAVIGSAVADTIHLVAELVDNATSFSPPRSQVQVHGSIAAKGVVVEVEDHGLGMSEEDRERANAMLADPPEFDAMALKGDSRLGLFVVARLAIRLGVRVELRDSPYGGTRAVILVPNEILASDVRTQLSDETLRELTKRERAVSSGKPVRTPLGPVQVPGQREDDPEDDPADDAEGGPDRDLHSFWADPLSNEDESPGRPINLLGGATFDSIQEERPEHRGQDRFEHEDHPSPRPAAPVPAPPTEPPPVERTIPPRPSPHRPAAPPERPEELTDPPHNRPQAPAQPGAQQPGPRQPGARQPGQRQPGAQQPNPDAGLPLEQTGPGALLTHEPLLTHAAPTSEPPPGERPALPVRRPQQNLAPQLLDSGGEAEAAADEQPPATDGRSAEQVRDTMSAFQRGTREGREADPFPER